MWNKQGREPSGWALWIFQRGGERKHCFTLARTGSHTLTKHLESSMFMSIGLNDVQIIKTTHFFIWVALAAMCLL